MSASLRRLISGPKARFVQDGVDLDLAYITDRLIIMAFPAAGVATMWRNDRRVVRSFLDERHKGCWRVYNFCPRGENEYDGDEFHGRVSRYPFPDHHPPPLSMIPMVVADMTAWLAEDPRNVVVIHCKAGKGRSGTLACCYLMSLPKLPSPPRDPRNLSSKEKRVDRTAAEEGTDRPASRQALSIQDESGGPSPNSQQGDLDAMDRPRRPSIALKARKSISALRSISDGRSRVLRRNADEPAQGSSRGPLPPESSLNPVATASTSGLPATPRRSVDAEFDSFADDSRRYSSANAPYDESVAVSPMESQARALGERMEAVFDLHSSRRMKPPKAGKDEVKARSRELRGYGDLSAAPGSLQSRFAASTPHLSRARAPSSSDPVRSRVVSPAHSLRAPICLSPQASELPSRSMGNLDATLGRYDGLRSPTINSGPKTPRLSFALASPSRDTAFSKDAFSLAAARPVVKQRSSSFRAPATSRPATHLGLTPMGKSVDNLNAGNVFASDRSFADPNTSTQRSVRSMDVRRKDLTLASSRPSTQLESRPQLMLNPNGSSQRFASLFESGNTASEVNLNYGAQDDVSLSQDDLGTVSPRTALSTKSRPKKLGVSIPSQRRWVGYWARILANTDPRATLDYMTPSKPQRSIRIVRVSVLQSSKTPVAEKDSKLSTAKKAAKALTKTDSFTVSIGRYNDALVDRLEGWERGARRRARAYGSCNPSARAPVLTFSKRHENLHQPPSCVPGEDAWKERSRRPSSADWDKCAEYNTAEAARKRLAQHDNEEGVGEWGVDVISEAERVRHFNWPDGHVYDEDPSSKDFRFLDWFSKLRETQRAWMDPDEYREWGSLETEQGEKGGVWHHFEDVAAGSSKKSTLAVSNDLCRGQSPPTPPRRSFQGTLRKGLARAAASATEPSQGHGGMSSTDGVLVSPDREVCIRLHLANKAFSILPDIAGAAGWVWFIPAFEDPLQSHAKGRKSQRPKPGMRTVARFERDEIDFAKRVTGLEALEVEWEWVDTGVDEEDESDDEEEDEETESLSDRDDVLPIERRLSRQQYSTGNREDSDGLTPSDTSLRTVSSRGTRTPSFTTAPTLATPVFESMVPSTLKALNGSFSVGDFNRVHPSDATGQSSCNSSRAGSSNSSSFGRLELDERGGVGLSGRGVSAGAIPQESG